MFFFSHWASDSSFWIMEVKFTVLVSLSVNRTWTLIQTRWCRLGWWYHRSRSFQSTASKWSQKSVVKVDCYCRSSYLPWNGQWPQILCIVIQNCYWLGTGWAFLENASVHLRCHRLSTCQSEMIRSSSLLKISSGHIWSKNTLCWLPKIQIMQRCLHSIVTFFFSNNSKTVTNKLICTF